jgi:photosystem II stability/assembly factor-like uncharacterized protein
MRPVVASLAVALLAAGCGTATIPVGVRSTPAPSPTATATDDPGQPFAALHAHDGGPAKLIATPPPASTALSGANDLLAADGSILAATDNGVYRSDDGGTTWRRLVAHVAVWSLTRTPDGGFAALGDRAPLGAQMNSPVVLTSRDGRRWKMVAARTPRSDWVGVGRMVLSGTGPDAVGVMVPDIVNVDEIGTAWRTRDGGRSWVPTDLKNAGTGLALASDGRTVYATAAGPGNCRGAVYRSVDAGVTWNRMPNSCRPYPLDAIQWLDARDGFAAGGMPSKFGGGQVVEATSDGGASWQTRWRVANDPTASPPPDSEFVRLDMLDATTGWALTGGCVGGQNGPCAGPVYRTVDGGAHWTDTGQRANALAAPDAQHAVAGQALSGPTALTTDGGRHWQSQSGATAVSTQALTGAGGWLLWNTTLGFARSTDGGATWSAFDPPAVTGLAYDTWLVAPPSNLLGVVPANERPIVRASIDNGRTWTEHPIGSPTQPADTVVAALAPDGLAMVMAGPGGSCLTSAQVAAVQSKKPNWQPETGPTELESSTDGGRSWRAVTHAAPFSLGPASPVAVSADAVALVDSCGDLEVSDDGGHRWRATPLGSTSELCQLSAFGPELWLDCDAGDGGPLIFHSPDRGTTWTSYEINASGADDTPCASCPLVATARDTAVLAAGGSLWQTTDDGKTWAQTWSRLPGEH